jgi:signal transduction histidine kinase
MMLYLQERAHEQASLQQQGRQRVAQESEFLRREIQAVRSDVLFLAEQEALQRFLSSDEAARRELASDYVSFAIRRAVYDQIRFLDNSGKEVIRVNFEAGRAEVVPEDKLQIKADRYYYRDALKLRAGEVFVSDFDLNVERGKIQQPLRPVLRFLAPVIDDAGEKQGLLAINYSGEYLLRKLNEVSLPGSTMLVNLHGEYIRALNPADAWGWLLGHNRSFQRHFRMGWREISSKPEGQFSNAEGLFTFRRVDLSDSRETDANATATNAASYVARPSDDPASTPLILVTYVPPELQHVGSTKLLRQLMLMYAGAMVLLLILGWYWARSACIREEQAQSIVASESRLRALSNQLLTAQEEERRSISRELHDELGQQVTAISLDLRSSQRQQDPARAQSLLSLAIEETDHLLKSLHEIASRVRPAVLDDLGLRDAVQSLVSETQRRTGIMIKTRFEFDEQCVLPRIGENVYRILQEGLSNITKHSQAQEACVTIELASSQLRMTIEDHGAGFHPGQRDTSRLGILGMQERAELLGGSFTLSSAPGAGARIEVSIPLQIGDR